MSDLSLRAKYAAVLHTVVRQAIYTLLFVSVEASQSMACYVFEVNRGLYSYYYGSAAPTTTAYSVLQGLSERLHLQTTVYIWCILCYKEQKNDVIGSGEGHTIYHHFSEN